MEGGLACRILALRGRQDLAHDHFAHVLRRNARPLQRCLDGNLAEIVRGKRCEGAVEGAYGRACRRYDDHVRHANCAFSGSGKHRLPRSGANVNCGESASPGAGHLRQAET